MQTAILYPVFVQIFMTLLIGAIMAIGRVQAIRSGRTHPSAIALDNSKWPDRLRKLGNSYGNQFELPVMFYLLCVIAMLLNMVDLSVILLAWGFVISRIVHAVIHTTNNRVTRRGLVFFMGALLVGILAAYLFIRLLLLDQT